MLRTFLKILLKPFGPNLVGFTYQTILKPKPLRGATNKILLKVIPEKVILPEGQLILNPTDPVVSGAIALGVYEPYVTTVIRQHLKPGSHFVDVGANLGYYSVIAAAKANIVWAFEPDPDNFIILKTNQKINNFINLKCYNFGLAQKSATKFLYLDADNKGKHSLLPISEEFVSIKLKKFDDIWIREGRPKIDFIKIDVEGWEAEVLYGMEQYLKANRPTIIFELVPDRIIQSGHDPLKLLKFLHDLNYKLNLVDENHKKLTEIFDVSLTVSKLSRKSGFTNLLALPKSGN